MAIASTVELVEGGTDGLVLRFTAPATGAEIAEAERLEADARVQAGPPELVSYQRPRGTLNGESGVWSASARGPASFSVMVQVPETGRVVWELGGGDLVGDEAARCVSVSEPAIMRDLRVVTVTFTPPAEPRGARRTLELSIGATAARGRNEKERQLPYLSPAFDRLYSSLVLNYESSGPIAPSSNGRDPVPDGARYLIITADSYESEITPLAEWKNLKGLLAKVVTLSEIGSTTAEIKAYIQDAYDTWPIPPEFVLLVGDTEQLPIEAIQHPTFLVHTDNYYAELEGDDVLSDVMIGRITADYGSHVVTQVAKILGYERTPVQGDPDWPLSATLLVADDYDLGDPLYYSNTRYIYDLMDEHSFAPIDTLFDKNGVTTQQVYNAVNDGTGFVNFRGQAWYNWPDPFDLNTNNVYTGWRLPVVVSATCATGIFHEDGFMCENWVRAGTSSNPKGGVAFFATCTWYETDYVVSLRRGYVDEGFFANVFDEGGLTLGEACLAGKGKMIKMTGNSEEYDGWQLLGDPAMNLWSGPMEVLAASHDMSVQPGHTDFTITVTDGEGYVEGALVACVKDNESYSWGYTDEFGEVTLAVDPTTEGIMSVTATARNSVPYEGTVEVVTGPHPALLDLAFDDVSGGNGDGYLSPGETSLIETELINIGTETATSVQAKFRTADSYVTIVDSVASFQDIPPDTALWGDDQFEVSVSPMCPRGHRVQYTLYITHSGTDKTLAPPPLVIEAGALSEPVTVIEDPVPGGDANGILSPNETVGLLVTLTNESVCDLASLSAVLSTDDPDVVITTATASYGDLPSGASRDNSAFPFVLSVSPSASDGHVIDLALHVTGDGGHYTYSDTLNMSFELVGGATLLPTGPDGYGYYVYDQTDGLFGPAPEYDWFDIAPPGPGTLITDVTDADAGVTTFATIWNFKYFGQTFNQLSVNSNGFLTAGWTDYRLGDNSPIPDENGPENMIAPFWDDLDPSAGGDVYKYFDTASHKWIIQFENVRHWGLPFEETFQVILLHPTYYPTPTGDAQIIFQYEEVSLADGCTIGFENEAEDDGTQCLYNGTYNPQIAPIGPGSALLLTTQAPSTGGLPWLVLTDVMLDDSALGNGNGRAEPGETVELAVELTNEGGLPAEGVSLTLSSSDGLSSISDDSGTMADLPSGASADNASDTFTLTLAESLGDTVATLWASVAANGGDYQGAQRVELHIDLSATGVDEKLPTAFRFQTCSPNPFAWETSFRLALPSEEKVSVRVYDVSGRLVRTLVDERMPPGERAVEWDGKDDSGHRCASGVYFARVQAGARTATRKAVLLR